MAKEIVGRMHRREGRVERLYTVLECTDCGHKTYERKAKRIEKALQAGCSNCIILNAKERSDSASLQRQQDKALIDAFRSLRQLHLKITKVDTRITHGLCRGDSLRTYRIWINMIARCTNPNDGSFAYYGGRGITVCDRWHDVATFISDMGLVPDGYSIERHDVNGNYEPFNCSWIPKGTQSANRRCSYSNRGIFDPKEYQNRKARILTKGIQDVSTIPFAYKNVGWWRENFGLYLNPYVYGPMPYTKTGIKARRAEAIERGWYVAAKDR